MFDVLLFEPIFNLAIFLYKLFGENFGLAIIVIAIISRAITLPTLKKQLDSAQKMRDLKPQLDKIKKKYKNDKQKFNEEQLKLYKDSGVNPLGGCLPMIIQLIFLIQIRHVIVALANDGVQRFNEVAYFDFLKFAEGAHIHLSFLGLDLGKVASDFSWNDQAIIPYVILALLVGITQYISTRILSPNLSDNKKDKDKDKKSDADETPALENMTQMMSGQMLLIFPVLTTLMALGYAGGSTFFSAALSIFWIVQNLVIVPQRLLMGAEQREKVLGKFKFLKKK